MDLTGGSLIALIPSGRWFTSTQLEMLSSDSCSPSHLVALQAAQSTPWFSGLGSAGMRSALHTLLCCCVLHPFLALEGDTGPADTPLKRG